MTKTLVAAVTWATSSSSFRLASFSTTIAVAAESSMIQSICAADDES